MTAATLQPAPARVPWRRVARRHGWTVGVWLLLAALVGWYASLIPNFSNFEVSAILRSGLPLAVLALGQAVIVIAGGIDLSIGAMLVLANVASARYMKGAGTAKALVIGLAVIVAAAALDGLVGWVISVSHIPDIVVTLATSFILAGFALAVLPSPGGGAPAGFRFLFTGSDFGIGVNPWPSLVAVAIPTVLTWVLLRRTRGGLGIYAVGSSRAASFLSGLSVTRARITAYAVGGALAAVAGLATTAITGGGDPRFTIGSTATLNSVAAAVLGGIALTGGVGSPLGAVAAGYALFLLSPILTALQVDPNQAQVVQGVLIVLVVMLGGLLQLRRRAE